MSSSPTAPTSTTASSTSSPSDPSSRVALIACGAIAQPCAAIVARHDWPVDVHPLPPLLHNQPQLIAGEVRALATSLRTSYASVAIGYADCGTYGALDEVCAELALARLPGLHCYDLYAGPSQVERFFAEQPGTYLLTDFLVRSFARTVIRELGLDRWPDLRDTYFGQYTRVVWLAQDPDDELRGLADLAAEQLGLPLTVVETGDARLESALESLLPRRRAAEGRIAVDDPRAADVRRLLATHVAFGNAHSPPEDVHALDVDALVDQAITFLSYRVDGELLAVGALKDLGDGHGELKSMHTSADARGRGIGRAMVDHLVALARSRGYTRLSLETGTPEVFAPARTLYASAGFVACPPFGDYRPSDYSTFLTLDLDGA